MPVEKQMTAQAMALQGCTLEERRAYMAKTFERTQGAMASAIDKLSLAKRTIPPYASTYMGASVSEHGPIPTDMHLIESGLLIVKADPPPFKSTAKIDGGAAKLGGKPWASFEVSQPAIFTPEQGDGQLGTPAARKAKVDEEMWRVRTLEWTLQKNAFNTDVAANLRTNVAKQCKVRTSRRTTIAPLPSRLLSELLTASRQSSRHALRLDTLRYPPMPSRLPARTSHLPSPTALQLAYVEKPTDAARLSVNVRAALTDSQVTGPTILGPRPRITPSQCMPAC